MNILRKGVKAFSLDLCTMKADNEFICSKCGSLRQLSKALYKKSVLKILIESFKNTCESVNF